MGRLTHSLGSQLVNRQCRLPMEVATALKTRSSVTKPLNSALLARRILSSDTKAASLALPDQAIRSLVITPVRTTAPVATIPISVWLQVSAISVLRVPAVPRTRFSAPEPAAEMELAITIQHWARAP